MDVNTKKTVILSLDEVEARWLQELVQNYMGPPDRPEDLKSQDMRRRFWTSIEEGLTGKVPAVPFQRPKQPAGFPRPGDG